MGVFAFNYLRADRSESQIGPFDYEFQAEERKSQFQELGAICSEVFPTDESPPEKKDNWAEHKLEEFKNFFDHEIASLQMEGVSYWISYHFLATALYRTLLFVADNDWSDSEGIKEIVRNTGYPPSFCRAEAAKIIIDEAARYTPIDGSFWEDYSKQLKEVAMRIRVSPINREFAKDYLLSCLKTIR